MSALSRTCINSPLILQNPALLANLSQHALEDRLYDLDTQFRRDMASLTDRYDDAQEAIQAALRAASRRQ
jgi:hypothetical protein